MKDKKSDSINDSMNAVTSLVKEIPIYQDAFQPLAKEVGKALVTIGKSINLALEPINGAIYSYDKIKSKLKSKLEKTPIENISSPKLSIAGPIFESLKYISDEDVLRDMYANLLANAMDTKTKNSVHPSFSEIIKQLSSEEANLLLFLSQQKNYPNICSYDREGGFVSDEIGMKFFELCSDFKDTCDIYSALDNYKRLQLLEIELEISQGISSSECGFNNQFDSSYDSIHEHIELSVRYFERISFTSLGVSFIKSCVTNKETESLI